MIDAVLVHEAVEQWQWAFWEALVEKRPLTPINFARQRLSLR